METPITAPILPPAPAPRRSSAPAWRLLIAVLLVLLSILATGCSVEQVQDETSAVTLLECDPAAAPLPSWAHAPDGSRLTCRSAAERRTDAVMLRSYRR